MGFEETEISKKPSKTAINKAAKEDLDQFTTGRIIWHLVKRHKFGLTAAYAVTISVFYFLPFVPILLSHML